MSRDSWVHGFYPRHVVTGEQRVDVATMGINEVVETGEAIGFAEPDGHRDVERLGERTIRLRRNGRDVERLRRPRGKVGGHRAPCRGDVDVSPRDRVHDFRWTVHRV